MILEEEKIFTLLLILNNSICVQGQVCNISYVGTVERKTGSNVVYYDF